MSKRVKEEGERRTGGNRSAGGEMVCVYARVFVLLHVCVKGGVWPKRV